MLLASYLPLYHYSRLLSSRVEVLFLNTIFYKYEINCVVELTFQHEVERSGTECWKVSGTEQIFVRFRGHKIVGNSLEVKRSGTKREFSTIL